jgi:hypothetical protein
MIGPERPGMVMTNSGPNNSSNFLCFSTDALDFGERFAKGFFLSWYFSALVL